MRNLLIVVLALVLAPGSGFCTERQRDGPGRFRGNVPEWMDHR